tara:strand:+ start:1070 stop:1657 length:588 start_codon:yes stop_codon:yes gene_type:complete
MYLSIATVVISLGSLIYFLIEHFNKQHHANNHVTLPAISVSKADYRKTEEFVRKMLKQAIEATKPSQPPPAGYTPSPDDFTKSDYEAMKNCLNNPKVETDLIKLLISKDQLFIEKFEKAMKELQSQPPPNMSSEQIRAYTIKLYKDSHILFQFQDMLLTVIDEDCYDVRSVITKIQMQRKRTYEMNEANSTPTNQ